MRQRATPASNITSALRRFTSQRKSRGTTIIPPPTNAARNPPSARSRFVNAAPSSFAPEAMVVRPVINRTATMSWSSSRPKITCRISPRTFWSSKTFATIIVLLQTMSTALEKTLSISLQPSARPKTHPSQPIALSSMTSVSPTLGTVCTSFRTLKPKPTENITKTTPKSDIASTRSGSAKKGMGR